MAVLTGRESPFDARQFLEGLWRDMWFQANAEWMHFHELAISDPFEAESEAQKTLNGFAARVFDALRDEYGMTPEDLGIRTPR